MNTQNEETPVVPEVGMGATYCIGSDSYSYTVIEVSASKRRIKIQSDRSTRVDNNGQSESQQYIHERDPNGRIEEYSLRQDGSWRRKGDDHRTGYVLLGSRRSYGDPSF